MTDGTASDGRGEVGPESDRELLSGRDFETVVLNIVKSDPFASIGEIKQTMREASSFEDTGWWQIFAVLRRHKLLRRRARFRFARGRR